MYTHTHTSGGGGVAVEVMEGTASLVKHVLTSQYFRAPIFMKFADSETLVKIKTTISACIYGQCIGPMSIHMSDHEMLDVAHFVKYGTKNGQGRF